MSDKEGKCLPVPHIHFSSGKIMGVATGEGEMAALNIRVESNECSAIFILDANGEKESYWTLSPESAKELGEALLAAARKGFL